MELKIYLVLVLINVVSSQDRCITQESCNACFQELGCSWCSSFIENESDVSVPQCQLTEKIQEICNPDGIETPLTSGVKPIQDNPLNPGVPGTDPVQLRPQQIEIDVRIGEQIQIPIQFKQAKDYPVDLYFLMDLSKSMEDDKEKLADLGNSLAETMKAITNNFRLGFGSFVDKTELPFVNTLPEKLAKPCAGCVRPYGFINNLPLSENTEKFSKEVKAANISGNIDTPEGGLDALVQAIVCERDIEWRKKARHIIVFSTDAPSHIAGDGKLAGILEKNDLRCHLDGNEYTKYALKMDYPSIGQINRLAIDYNINIIFAVTERQGKLYSLLKDKIKGASHGTLDRDSANVVNLVREEYEKIVDSVTLNDNSDKFVNIKYYSNCLSSENAETRTCEGLKGQTLINFTAVITAVDCPKDGNYQRKIKIKPDSIDETLEITLNLQCECNCKNTERNSPSCTGNGTRNCGVCECNDGFYGRHCECGGTQAVNNDVTASCKYKTKDGEELLCNGQGTCKCGVCQCKKNKDPSHRIYGKHCQCDNYSCNRVGSMLCSGQGECDCGKCKCNSGFKGDACECSDTNSTCTAPGSQQICSGKGDCSCGGCKCHTNGTERYTGKYCEECSNCKGQRCDELSACVECKVFKTGSLDEKSCHINCPHSIVTVDSVTKNDVKEDEKFCLHVAGCNINFKYKYDATTDKFVITVQQTQECAKEIDVLALVLGLIGSILLAGLLMLLAWKVVTSIHDKREYTKFEQDRAKAKWDRGENPLYKPSTSHFANPAFGRRSLSSK